MNDLKLKLSFITGLKEIALNEIIQHPNFRIVGENADSIYLDFIQDLTEIKNLRSVSRAYIIIENPKYNPLYISNHKSILGGLIEMVVSKNKEVFKSFKITCAGSDSPEVRSVAKYVEENWGLIEKEEADLKIHMIKHDDIWEIGIQITPRPLSVRAYKVRNMSGAMDPTVAYALNSLCGLDQAESYLNVFSGSATLLIEAGQCYPNLKKLIGFDNNKKHISLAIQNIKKAGLIQKIELKEKDIVDKPDLGKFDVITSDLPFGMSISKDEDLDKLYQCFIEYCEQSLNHAGILAVYTSEHEMLEKIIRGSRFKVIKTLELKFITSVDAYLRPKIFVCKFK
ncbi:methyltransferase domain-containing protein [Patescibacteria group bacterium]|nr:methyltransferase domain-containing protein [Patescibacteria group bacterium]